MPTYCVVYVEQVSRGLTCSQFIRFKATADAEAWDSFSELTRRELTRREGEKNPSKLVHFLEMVRIEWNGDDIGVRLIATNPHVAEFILSGRSARLAEIVAREEEEAAAKKAKLWRRETDALSGGSRSSVKKRRYGSGRSLSPQGRRRDEMSHVISNRCGCKSRRFSYTQTRQACLPVGREGRGRPHFTPVLSVAH